MVPLQAGVVSLLYYKRTNPSANQIFTLDSHL